MTLAEIMVCLGVIAVVAGMVVSFATLMGDRTKGSSATLETEQDLKLIKTVTEAWLEQMTEENATFSVSGSTITATVDGVDTPYELRFANGILTYKMRNDSDPQTLRTEHIKKLTFTTGEDVITEAEQVPPITTDILFFCEAECKDSGETVTFAINPRVGETVGG